MRRASRELALACVIGFAPLLAGCGLATKNSPPSERQAAARTPASPGEREGTAPAQPHALPVNPAASARAAVERFAERYVNWTWRSLLGDQRRLAATAVGEARASELQAYAATERDTALARGRVFNSGTVIAVAPVNGGPGDEWACVTREQTGGQGEYAALVAAYHVTLATVHPVPGGFAVSSWRPEL
jgi:hypothetical protein